jgi:hypothetical protein
MWSTDPRERSAAIKSPLLLIAALGQGPKGPDREKLRKAYARQVERITDRKVAYAEDAKHFIVFDEPEWMWREMDTFGADKEPE